MSDDRFFEQLRADAGSLQYRPDQVAVTRIRALIRERIERPTVAQVMARWFAPIAASLTAIALAAALGLALAQPSEEPSFGTNTVEISMAGGTYLVGN